MKNGINNNLSLCALLLPLFPSWLMHGSPRPFPGPNQKLEMDQKLQRVWNEHEWFLAGNFGKRHLFCIHLCVLQWRSNRRVFHCWAGHRLKWHSQCSQRAQYYTCVCESGTALFPGKGEKAEVENERRTKWTQAYWCQKNILGALQDLARVYSNPLLVCVSQKQLQIEMLGFSAAHRCVSWFPCRSAGGPSFHVSSLETHVLGLA